MSDDEPATSRPSGSRRWYLIGTLSIIVVTMGVAIAITWIAIDGEAQTEASLDTAAAAENLRLTLADAPIGEPGQPGTVELDACPAGPAAEVLGDVAEALGGGQLQQVVDQGEIVIRVAAVDGGTDVFVDCTAENDDDDPSSLGLFVTAAPPAVVGVLRASAEAGGGEPLDALGSSRGGQYLGRCQRVDTDCGVFWYDDQLLVGIGGSGPAFADLDAERVQVVLAAALPTLVDGLAQS